MASLPKPRALAPVRWRPLAAHDLPVVAALEARIHAAPWSERNFRDALAAGYSARVGVRGERIVAYGVLMLGPGEAQLLNLSVVPECAPRRDSAVRCCCSSSTTRAALYAEQLFLEVRVSNTARSRCTRPPVSSRIARRVAYYPPGEPGGTREDALVMRCALSPSVVRTVAMIRRDDVMRELEPRADVAAAPPTIGDPIVERSRASTCARMSTRRARIASLDFDALVDGHRRLHAPARCASRAG